MQHRKERVAGEVQRILIEVLYGEINDPRIPHLLSVNEVQMNRDLSLATIYVSTMGDDDEKQEMMEGLNQAKGFLRTRVAEGINLRVAPDLRFVLDESLERGNRMSAFIDQVRAEDAARNAKLEAQRREDHESED
ncbi:MAG: 30S ribosome-binding factor RbfA [Eubacteriales bacterium]|nr:30S ribosome-binding factor RbfA [Clostridiales bacterium]MDY5835591.1 30S ribosome-binding factor RbfA [Eubacteriales bacterium]